MSRTARSSRRAGSAGRWTRRRASAGIGVVGNQRFGPEGDLYLDDLPAGKEPLEAARRKQAQLLDGSLRDVCAQRPIVLAFEPTRQELNERQMVVALERVPIVRRSDEPALPHPHDFVRELALTAGAHNVLDDGVGEDEVEAAVGKRQRAAVEDNVA